MTTTAITASTMIVLSTLKKYLSFSIAKISENKSSLNHGKLKLKRVDSRVCKSNGVHLESLNRKSKPLLEFVASFMLKLGRIFPCLKREREGRESERQSLERGGRDAVL
ncbi:hypothetical protein AMTRI_Chr07g29270 [Amborella trichopoda]